MQAVNKFDFVEPQKKKRGIWPLPVRRWGPEKTCRMDRAEFDTHAVGIYISTPVKCAWGYTSLCTLTDCSIYHTRSIYICVVFDSTFEFLRFQRPKTCVSKRFFQYVVAPLNNRSDIFRNRLGLSKALQNYTFNSDYGRKKTKILIFCAILHFDTPST